LRIDHSMIDSIMGRARREKISPRRTQRSPS
jgi:hypothetical protein